MSAPKDAPGSRSAGGRDAVGGAVGPGVDYSVFELLPGAVYVCDGAGAVVWYNRRAVELWGRAPQVGETERQFWEELRLSLPDGTSPPYGKTPMGRVSRTGKPARDVEIAFERPDGARADILVNVEPLRDAAGRPIGTITCFLDITARARAARDDLLQNAPIPFQIVAPDGTILFANPAELELLGHAAENHIGRNIADFHVDEQAAHALLDRLVRGEVVHNYESRLYASDRSVRHVLINASPQFRDGAFVHARCVTMDMTEHIDLQERLLLAQEAGGIGTFDRDYAIDTVEVSPSYWGLFGVAANGFPRTYEGWLSRVHPDDRDRVRRGRMRAFESGAYDMEYRVIWPDGQVRWLQTRGILEFSPDRRPLRLKGAIVDITDQKAAETALRRQELELRRITDAAPALISYVDADERFRLANRAYVDWFGRPREEVEGRHVREVIGEATYAAARPQIEQVLRGELAHYEGRRMMPDGSERDVEATYVPRFGRDGQVLGFYAFVNDITEQRRALTKLRTHTALLETVLETVPAAVWVSEDPDGTVISGSRYAARLFRTERGRNLSLTPRQGSGPRPWKYIRDGIELPIAEWPLRRALRGEVVRSEELDLVHGEDDRLTLLVSAAPLFDADGTLAGAVSAGMDITDRARTEQALRSRTAELEAIMDTVPAAIWLARGSDAGEIEASRYALQLFRMGPGAAHFKTASEAERPDHYSIIRDGAEVADGDMPLQRAARGEQVREEELEIRFRDGRNIPMLINASPLRDESGRTIGSVGAGIDIGARKRAEEQQHLLTAELDHRVKNMLSTVLAMVTRTASQHRSATELAEALNGRILAMARAHERLSASSWEGVNLRTLVEDELEPFAVTDRASYSGPDIVLSAKAATSLALVIHELVTNAAKYGALSRDTGQVSIRWRCTGVRREPADAVLEFRWIESGGPAVSQPRNRGFGSTLIERALAFEFGGEAHIEWPCSGLRVAFNLPLDKVKADRVRLS